MTRLSLFPPAFRAADRLSRRRRPRLDQFAPPPMPHRPLLEPDLEAEEERSLLGSILGGVQYVGETLDKPGAAVRGALAGKPGQLLNLIPFSDTMGITETEDRVSGRELLEKAGMLRRNRPGLDAGDMAGFGVEVGLDPLTWLMGPLYRGATTAGKAGAKATGSAEEVARALKAFKAATQAAPGEISAAARKIRTPATYAEAIRRGEQPIAALKVPFAKKPFKEFKLGPNTPASDMAARALESMFYGGRLNPIVGARSLFSHTAGGEPYVGAAQRLKDIKYAEKMALRNQVLDIAPTLRRASGVLQETYQDIAKAHEKAGDLDGFNAFTRAMLEVDKIEIPAADEMQRVMAETMGVSEDAFQAVDEVDRLTEHADVFLQGLKDTENIAYKRVQDLGMRGEELDDIFAAHFGRRPSNPEIFTTGEAKLRNRAAQDQFEFAMGRNVLWRHVPGGTRTINQWATDDLLLGTKLEGDEVVRLSKAEHTKALKTALKKQKIPVEKDAKLADLQMAYFRKRLYEPELERAWQDVTEKRLVGYGESKNIDEAIRGPAKKLDRGEFLQSIFDTAGEGGKTRAEAMVSFFNRHAEEIHSGGLFDQRVVDDWFGYMTSLAHTESTLRSTHRYLDQLAGSSAVRLATDDDLGMVSLSKAWADAGFHRRGMQSFVGRNVDAFGDVADEKAMEEAIGNLVIDENAAEGLKAFKEITSPKTQNAIVSMLDKVTASYKGLLTIPWPSFHSRNLLSGLWQSATDGQVPFKDLLKGYTAAWRHMATRGKEPLEFIDEIIENGVVGPHGRMVDIAGEAAAERAYQVPEGPAAGVFGAFFEPGLKERGWQALNPLSMRGVVDDPKFLFGKSGERLYEGVEFLNRAGYYNALRKKGFGPSEALAMVKRSQFDYGELSRFEKSVARRAVPFWTWTRKNIPYQLTKLAERPGGTAAQTYRAFNQQNPDEYVPSFLREGMSFRTGGTGEAASFFRQSGIPIEDLNTFVFRRGLPAGRTLEKAAARLHPLLNMPIELFAEKQLFTGRKIKHLRSTTEAISGAFGAPTPVPWLDRALHYSPISRAVGEALGVMDARKTPLQRAMNALTGVKTSTYDVDKWRLIDLQNALKEQLSASPYVREGTYHYVPERFKQEAAAVGPQEQIRLTRALAKAVKELQARRAREADSGAARFP